MHQVQKTDSRFGGLDKEWLQLLDELVTSGVYKEKFKEFLETRRLTPASHRQGIDPKQD